MMSRIRVLLLLLASSLVQSGRFGCPPIPAPRPCFCRDSSRGLEFSCDSATLQDLSNSIKAIADKRTVVSFLTLKNLTIGHLGKSLLGNLTAVGHFIAINCSVTSIDEDAFAGLKDDLGFLYLGHNKLEHVPTAALEGLANLHHLYLENNQIEILCAGAFRGLTSLFGLNLFGNRIKSVDDSAFEGIESSLTRLNLDDNELNSIPYRPIRNLKYLKNLKLHKNKITHLVQEGFFVSAERLDSLQLSSNQVEEIPAKAFANLKRLQLLDLESNQIRHIHPEAFDGTDRLWWLTLRDNKLSTIPAEPLRRTKSLMMLDLGMNSITKILDDDFEDYEEFLKYIYLDRNRIHTIEVNAFKGLTFLPKVYLEKNQLSVVSSDIFHPVLHTLGFLNLQDNPFNCDCRIAWFRKLLRNKNSRVGIERGDNRCETPQQLKGREIAHVSEKDLGCFEESTPAVEDSSPGVEDSSQGVEDYFLPGAEDSAQEMEDYALRVVVNSSQGVEDSLHPFLSCTSLLLLLLLNHLCT